MRLRSALSSVQREKEGKTERKRKKRRGCVVLRCSSVNAHRPMRKERNRRTEPPLLPGEGARPPLPSAMGCAGEGERQSRRCEAQAEKGGGDEGNERRERERGMERESVCVCVCACVRV